MKPFQAGDETAVFKAAGSEKHGTAWKLMTQSTGIAQFLKTKGAQGWPDISVGGPGFCFPVERWDGRKYKPQRWEYKRKPSRPSR